MKIAFVVGAFCLAAQAAGAAPVRRLVLEGPNADDRVVVDGVTDDAREAEPEEKTGPGPEVPRRQPEAPPSGNVVSVASDLTGALVGAGPDSSGQAASDLSLTPLSAVPPGSPPGTPAVSAPAGTLFFLPGSIAAQDALGTGGGTVGASVLDGAVGPGALPQTGTDGFTGGTVGPGALP